MTDPLRLLAEIPIVIDTREQRPFEYPATVKATLKTGDYSVIGLEDRVAIERKAHSDLLMCIGSDRDRFRDQVTRLGELDFGAVVIEPSIRGIIEGTTLSKMKPASVINTCLSWSVRYGVPFLFAGSREIAQALTGNLLRFALREYGDPDKASAIALAMLRQDPLGGAA